MVQNNSTDTEPKKQTQQLSTTPKRLAFGFFFARENSLPALTIALKVPWKPDMSNSPLQEGRKEGSKQASASRQTGKEQNQVTSGTTNLSLARTLMHGPMMLGMLQPPLSTIWSNHRPSQLMLDVGRPAGSTNT